MARNGVVLSPVKKRPKGNRISLSEKESSLLPAFAEHVNTLCIYLHAVKVS